MNCLQLLKKNKITLESLPEELRNQIGEYSLGLDKIKEVEALELDEEDLKKLNEQKQQLAYFDTEITNSIMIFIAQGEKDKTPKVEEPAKKRGRKPSVKEVSTEEKAPAKRGRKTKEDAPVVEVKEPAKRGRKPKSDVAPIEQKEPAKRGRKPKNTDTVLPITDEAPSINIGSEEKEVKDEVKEVSHTPNKRGRNVDRLSTIRRVRRGQEAVVLSDEERKQILVKLDEANREFYPLQADVDENAQEVSQLQEEIAGEFDRVEKISNNKRKLFWGLLCAFGAAALAVGGINLMKESK